MLSQLALYQPVQSQILTNGTHSWERVTDGDLRQQRSSHVAIVQRRPRTPALAVGAARGNGDGSLCTSLREQ